MRWGRGTTAGTFSTVFDIDAFAGGDANISGLHYVSRAVTVGTVNPVSLQAGDVLLSVDANATLGGAAVTTKDIVLFRPTTPVVFQRHVLGADLNPGNTGAKVRDFALVEAPVTVGGTNLQAGDFWSCSAEAPTTRTFPCSARPQWPPIPPAAH